MGLLHLYNAFDCFSFEIIKVYLRKKLEIEYTLLNEFIRLGYNMDFYIQLYIPNIDGKV